MRPFRHQAPSTLREALDAAADSTTSYLGGGTTLVDLMKLDVLRPAQLVDLAMLPELSLIEAKPTGLHIGALARMADVAAHPVVRREYPALSQSLLLAASPQIRNMARVGGNLVQRTRCSYYRDISFEMCNRRSPGSGCAAIQGNNRGHAILGTSAHCIATYPGDFAVALVALGATLELRDRHETRLMPLERLHRLPGSTPDLETTLKTGEMITAIHVPAGPWTRRSLYLKIRDRSSYSFALASAAVALSLDGDRVREARIGLGGVATVPWRASAAETVLRDQPINEAVVDRAVDAAFASALPREHNAFKIDLGRRTLSRALLTVAQMEPGL